MRKKGERHAAEDVRKICDGRCAEDVRRKNRGRQSMLTQQHVPQGHVVQPCPLAAAGPSSCCLPPWVAYIMSACMISRRDACAPGPASGWLVPGDLHAGERSPGPGDLPESGRSGLASESDDARFPIDRVR